MHWLTSTLADEYIGWQVHWLTSRATDKYIGSLVDKYTGVRLWNTSHHNVYDSEPLQAKLWFFFSKFINNTIGFCHFRTTRRCNGRDGGDVPGTWREGSTSSSSSRWYVNVSSRSSSLFPSSPSVFVTTLRAEERAAMKKWQSEATTAGILYTTASSTNRPLWTFSI